MISSVSPSRGRMRRPWITFALLLASGLGMLVPGLYLVGLGGSLYYPIAGALLVLAALLVLRRNRLGLYLYGLIFAGTVVWSVAEVGLDGWALMPRLAFLAVGGLWLLAAPVRRTMIPDDGRRSRIGLGAVLAVGAVGILLLFVALRPIMTGGTAAAAAIPASEPGEWTHYGSSLGGSRYSALGQITPANARRLAKAWEFHPGITIPGGKRKGGLQMTPLMVDGLVYGCTAFSSIFALDPVTGKQVWRHDPGVADEGGGHPACRGLAFFRAPAGTAECPTRLLLGTVDNRLIAVDAKTGARCRSFGDNGQTDLRAGMGDFPKNWHHPTSPPTIVGGVAVIGHYIVDNQSTEVPPGVIRGYDAVTGRLRWAFDPAKPDKRAPLAPGETYTPSTPNSWTIFSGDEALGLVYVPMGNGSPDFWGANRGPASARFGAALVALDAATGAVRWTFQAVHHDLWDYDLSAQPALVDFPTQGGSTPALILPTKSAQVFVLDRRTGQPLTQVVERPVPQSTLPGERTSPTQPFSVGMPDFKGPDLTERDMWGLTPFDQLYCRIKFRQARYDGAYTPMRLGPTIRYPGELGGIDWGSVSIDEDRRLLIVNSNRMADYDELITRAQAEREGLKPRVDPRGHNAPGAAMAGTPYAAHWGAFLSGLGVPCQKPPYGMLTAVDLATRKVVWQRPIGNSAKSGPFGYALNVPLPLGAPNIGGSIATRGGVVFMGATQDEYFRAINAATGKTLWETKLPFGGHATPMTYRGRDGRQYVVIAAGGSSMKNQTGDAVVAFRLE